MAGLGSPDRGDDGVGPAVVARLTASAGLPPDVRTVVRADPTDLPDLWDGVDLAVLVDAVLVDAGRAPGSLLLLRTGPGEPPLPAGTGGRGSHGFGLADAVELARTLGRLPRRVVLLGVVAARADPGRSLSGPVAAAVDVAADRVRRLLR